MGKRFKNVLGGGTLALASAVILPSGVFAADTTQEDAIQTYELGEVEIVGHHAEEPATQQEEPAVAYAGGQVARKSQLGVLGERDFMETPFNVLSFTEEHIQNRQAQTVQDLVADDPSVQNSAGSSANNLWTIRGMSLDGGDIAYNGIFNVGPRYTNSVDSVERVDVLKGPSALLYGMAPNGSIGGSINLVPKRAKDEPIRRFALSYGNGSQFGQSIDVGERFGKDKEYGVRINVAHRNGSTSFDREKQKTTGVAVAFDVRRNKWRASLDMGYLHREFKNPTVPLLMTNPVIASLKSLPRLSSNSLNLADNGAYTDATERYGLLRGDYEFDTNWSAYAAIGLRNSTQDSFTSSFMINNVNGNAAVRLAANARESHANTEEVGVKGKLQTGDLKHEMTVAFNRTHWTSYKDVGSTLRNYTTNFYNIGLRDAQSFAKLPVAWSGEYTLSGLALTDVISVPNDRWQFILGARYQKIKGEQIRRDLRLRGNYQYDEAAWSPAYAVLFKATPKVSLYATYIQGLQEGEQADRWALNAGEVFAPIKTKSTEAGVKFDLGKFATSLSVFEMEKPTTFDDYINANDYYQRQVNYKSRGVEISFFGEPRTGTRILGGITWVSAKYAPEANHGNTVVSVPNKKAALSVEQDIHGVSGLSVFSRMTYTGDSYYDAKNIMKIPAWFTMDLGARYAFHVKETPVTVRFDVNNVFDRHYWRGVAELGRRAMVGTGRTFMLSVTADF